MSFRHLVEDLHTLTRKRRMRQRELDAADAVPDVDKRTRLAAGSMDGQRIADRGLHQEAVQNGAVIAVVIEAVDQPLVESGLGRLRSPDDSLVEIRDPDAVVLVVVGEEQ